MKARRRSALGAGLAAVLWLSGCAAPVTGTPPLAADAPSWSGRLSLRVDSTPQQTFAAMFDLRGSAQAGELVLTTPLGSTLAQLSWVPGRAVLRSPQETREFDSVDALIAQVTGTAIPVAALFGWLGGQPAAVDGWQADLSQFAEGRLQASRTAPAPAADLRLAFQRQ